MSQPRPTTTGASFSVDLDRAAQAIRDLEDAARQLEDIRDSAMMLGKVTPPAQDQVSMDAATVLSAAANGGEGSFVHAANLGIVQIRSLISEMRAELHSYAQSEESNSRALFPEPYA